MFYINFIENCVNHVNPVWTKRADVVSLAYIGFKSVNR